MNYIDSILQHLDTLSADDVIQKIGENIYKEVISRDEIYIYPQFIKNIIFLVDMDTELHMQGDLSNDSIKKYIPNMIVALQNIHADNEADILKSIYGAYNSSRTEKNDDNYDEIDTLVRYIIC